MINAGNIARYIDYLYHQKYGQPAPAEVLESWAPLPDGEIAQHLTTLYQHWGMDAAAARQMEQQYTGTNAPAQPAGYAPPAYAPPPGQSQYTPPASPASYGSPAQPVGSTPGQQPVAPVRKQNPWKIVALVGVLAALGAGGWMAYQWNQNRTDETATSTPPASEPTTQPTTTTTPVRNKPLVEALPMNAADDQNVASVRSLMASEDQQDFDGIMSHFSPNMERYWDISYPTRAQLETRYADSWSKITDPQNVFNGVRKVAENTYDVSNTFRYYSLKDGKTKSVKGTNRFVFNDEGLVVQVWGLK